MLTLLPTIIQPVALTVTLVYVVGLLGSLSINKTMTDLILGCLFTLGVVASMAAPLTLGEGIIVDMRNLLVGAAMALLGPIPGLLALAGGAITRLLIGGQGAMLGVLGMTVAATAGLVWRYTLRHWVPSKGASFVLLGVLISAHLPVGLLLDEPFRTRFLFEVIPVLFGMNLLGSLLLGAMMEREKLRLSEVEELRVAASTDPLTNLLNRRKLSTSAKDLPAQFNEETGRVVLCFDIDNFKGINDTHGHTIGDAVLLAVSDRISQSLRPDDLFSRLGGDEFAIVLPRATQTVAKMVANRCCKLVSENPIDGPDGPIVVTISVGGNWANKDNDVEVMLNRADEALYQAKRQGRNRAVVQFTTSDKLPLAS